MSRQIYRKAARRLIPFLILLYLLNYVDRVNVGFAALTMSQDIGLTEAMFGLGAGIFFIGYFLFEVPSNVMLHKVGARIWIARIVVTWGLIATATAFVQGPGSFLTMRVLLGIAEAGFFPGILLYLTFWFPRRYRAAVVGLFYLAHPLASLLGAPLSTLLMEHTSGWFGLEGWRMMFLVEGIPTIVLGVVTYFYLTDRPHQAKWLTSAERDHLVAELANEERDTPASHTKLRAAFTDIRVVTLGFVLMGISFGIYALNFFLPQIVNGFQEQFDTTFSLVQVGLITAIPYAFGIVAMVLWSRHSDRRQERVWHTAIPLLIGAVSIAVALYMPSPFLAMAAISVTTMCLYAALPPFWQLPTVFLGGVAAAGGLAIVNSIGNLSGFTAPYLTGWLKEVTSDYRAGLLVVSGFMVVSAVIALTMRNRLIGSTEGAQPTSGPDVPQEDPDDREKVVVTT